MQRGMWWRIAFFRVTSRWTDTYSSQFVVLETGNSDDVLTKFRLFQHKELEKLASKPEEQQTASDSRVRAWVQATGECLALKLFFFSWLP